MVWYILHVIVFNLKRSINMHDHWFISVQRIISTCTSAWIRWEIDFKNLEPWWEVAVGDFDEVEYRTVGLGVHIHQWDDDKRSNGLGHQHRIQLSGRGAAPHRVKPLTLDIPGIQCRIPNGVGHSQVAYKKYIYLLNVHLIQLGI